ncbi:MAG: hypothetical protein GXY86_07075 [Firmicutes bacterium]|nr:hypothetical protein [Bacillota bacterium]
MLTKKLKWKYLYLLGLVLLLFSGAALADSPMVTIEKNEVITRDKFVGAQSLRHNGTIEGDLFFGTHDIWSTGTVTGDIIGAASELTVNGPVLGNIRIAGGTIDLDGKTGKNVNVFGGEIILSKNAEIGGNLLVFGEEIDIDGKVKGYTHIEGHQIVLKGEFFGDVDVNTSLPIEELAYSEEADEISTLKISSGTVIHGKLKYRGTQLDIESGAEIGDVDWIKPAVKTGGMQVREIIAEIWNLVRLILGTAVYFLLGLAFYRLFPKTFQHQAELIKTKPFNIAGVGLLGLVSTLSSLILFIILLAFSALINPGIGLIFGTAMTLGYILLFYCSSIPVALWLGGLMLKQDASVPYRFGVGLATITIGLFILKFLAKLPVVGPVFPLLRFMLVFSVLIMGTGALLSGAKFLFIAVRQGEQTVVND